MTFTGPIRVEYPCSETDAERKARIAAGLPAPTYAFMVSGYVDKQEGEK